MTLGNKALTCAEFNFSVGHVRVIHHEYLTTEYKEMTFSSDAIVQKEKLLHVPC